MELRGFRFAGVELLEAPYPEESLFRATARLRVPDEVPTEELRDLLEPLANELMVDLALEEPAGRP